MGTKVKTATCTKLFSENILLMSHFFCHVAGGMKVHNVLVPLFYLCPTCGGTKSKYYLKVIFYLCWDVWDKGKNNIKATLILSSPHGGGMQEQQKIVAIQE